MYIILYVYHVILLIKINIIEMEKRDKIIEKKNQTNFITQIISNITICKLE